MSIESYNQFHKEVMQDSALQEQLKAVAATSPESLGNLVVKLGAERGYNFTLENIQQATVEAASSSPGAEEALKDEELEMISGGTIVGILNLTLKAGTVAIDAALPPGEFQDVAPTGW